MIERCPRCDYLQAGLPAEHDCPECGLGFDAKSERWRFRARGDVVGQVFAGLGLLFLTVYNALGYTGEKIVSRLFWAVGAGVAVIVIVRSVQRAGRLWREGASIVVTRDGLYIDLVEDPAMLCAWSDLDKADVRTGWTRTKVRVTFRGRRAPLDASRFFGSRKEAERFGDIVNSYIRWTRA